MFPKLFKEESHLIVFSKVCSCCAVALWDNPTVKMEAIKARLGNFSIFFTKISQALITLYCVLNVKSCTSKTDV